MGIGECAMRYKESDLVEISVKRFLLDIIADRKKVLRNDLTPTFQRLVDLEEYVLEKVPDERLPFRDLIKEAEYQKEGK